MRLCETRRWGELQKGVDMQEGQDREGEGEEGERWPAGMHAESTRVSQSDRTCRGRARCDTEDGDATTRGDDGRGGEDEGEGGWARRVKGGARLGATVCA